MEVFYKSLVFVIRGKTSHDCHLFVFTSVALAFSSDTPIGMLF